MGRDKRDILNANRNILFDVLDQCVTQGTRPNKSTKNKSHNNTRNTANIKNITLYQLSFLRRARKAAIPRLVKAPLNVNGGLAKLGLTSVIRLATGVLQLHDPFQ